MASVEYSFLNDATLSEEEKQDIADQLSSITSEDEWHRSVGEPVEDATWGDFQQRHILNSSTNQFPGRAAAAWSKLMVARGMKNKPKNTFIYGEPATIMHCFTNHTKSNLFRSKEKLNCTSLLTKKRSEVEEAEAVDEKTRKTSKGWKFFLQGPHYVIAGVVNKVPVHLESVQ